MLIWTCICDFISEKIDERNADQDFADPWSISGSLGFCLTVWKPPAWGPVLGGGGQIKEAGRFAAFSTATQLNPRTRFEWLLCIVPRMIYNRSELLHTVGRFISSWELINSPFSEKGWESESIRLSKQSKPDPPQITKVSAAYVQTTTVFKTLHSYH